MKAAILLLLLFLAGGPAPISLHLSTNVTNPNKLVTAHITVQPDYESRKVCLEYDSPDGEYANHCWDHVGQNAPIHEFYQFKIGSPGDYLVTAYLVKVRGVVKSISQNLYIR